MNAGEGASDPVSEALVAEAPVLLYVLVAAGPEDVLKVGTSHDVLARWSAFHPRWFEAFDLDRSLLVAAQSRKEGRAMETRLHRALRAHACPVPMTMRPAAGGSTEWYRGAWATVHGHVDVLAAEGYPVAMGARGILRPLVQRQRERLPSVLELAWLAHGAGQLTGAARTALQDALDAQAAFGAELAFLAELPWWDELGLRVPAHDG